jgi:hypothetical protein
MSPVGTFETLQHVRCVDADERDNEHSPSGKLVKNGAKQHRAALHVAIAKLIVASIKVPA